ncbi:hypothetical protein ACFUTV_22855 [Streptomyces sp. NPDC057298]|uniref:hypothetical protein n=1 Tax=Streptomyces sp. NPDC057298 TaxID=3346091 RepID=UPI00362B8C77
MPAEQPAGPGQAVQAAALPALPGARSACVRRGLPAHTPDIAAEGAAALHPAAGRIAGI